MFPPAADKAAWEKLDSELPMVLGNELQEKPLEEKLNILGGIVYYHCLGQFGDSERKEVTSPNKTRKQRRIEERMSQKNAVRKRFKTAVGLEKDGVLAIWQELKTVHSVLCRVESFCCN